MNKFMRESKGAISIFLIIVLLPMMTMAGVFIDLARSKLAQEVVVSSADLAINTVLTDYDKDLKDYFGLIASSQNTDDVISVSKQYFADSLISAGFDTDDAQIFVDNVVSAFIGDEDIQDMLQLSVEGEMSITRTKNGALNNTALLKEGISEFMKYRSPVNGVADLFAKICESDISKQLEDASAETKMVEAREAFLKAEKKLIKKAEEAYKAIKKYEKATAHTGDLYASEGFLNKFSEFLINPMEHSGISNGNELANTIGRDWTLIYKDAHIKLTMNLFNTHNTNGDLAINLIKSKGIPNPGVSSTFSDSNKADASDLKDLLSAFNTAVSNYYSKRAALNSAWNNTGALATTDWPIQYWVKLTNNCESKRDAYITAANKVWDLGNELYNALSYLETDVFKDQTIKRPSNNYVSMPPADNDGMVKLEDVKDALWDDYNANIFPEIAGGGCSSFRNVNSQASSLNNTTNQTHLKHSNVTHIYNIGSELQRFINDAEEAAKLLKDAKDDVEALKDLMKDYKDKFDKWKTAAYDSSLDNSTMATGDNGDRKLIEEYEENGMIDISDDSVDELAGRIGNTMKLFETLAKDMKGIKYNGTSVAQVTTYNKFRSASKLDASKIPVNEKALRDYAEQTFSFSIGKQIQRIEIWGGRTSDSFDGGEYYYITDSFHPVLTKPTAPALYQWLEYMFGNPSNGPALNKAEHGFDVSNEDSADEADKKIEGKGDEVAQKVDTSESTKGNSFGDWKGAALPSDGKNNPPEPKSVTAKLSDAASYVSDLFSDFSGTFGATLENTRDDLFAEDYIFSMFTFDTFEKEGYYSLLEPEVQKQVTALNADSKYESVKEKWDGDKKNLTLTLTPRNAQNNWCYGGEIEYILYGNGSNAVNKTSAYANVYLIRYALDLKPVIDLYWDNTVVILVANALEKFAFIPAALTKTMICLAITAGEAAADISYLKQGIPVLIYKSEEEELFCNYKNVFSTEEQSAGSRDGICLQYSDYLKMFLFLKFKSDENQVYLRTGDVIQANVSLSTNDYKFELAKSQVFYTLHADVIMEPMWSRLLAIDDLGDLSTGKGWRTISITTTGGY